MRMVVGVVTGIGALLAVALMVIVNWEDWTTPELAARKAAELIDAAPEFKRFAVVVQVEDVRHLKGSMASVSDGEFSFRYLNSPTDTAPIKAKADFRYWEGSWHLNQFEYGCPVDCHIVN